MQSPVQSYLETLHERVKANRAGELANYIPELARADPEWFGICLVTMDGVAYGVGDWNQPFTIQSISKAFVYAAALADRGNDFVRRKVGVEPSGDAFNSISLHPQTGAPFNPMINAGAIASTGMVGGATKAQKWKRIESLMADFAGHPLAVDESVFGSESETGHRNRAIAWMLKNFGIIDGDPMEALDNYFRQCSLLVTCRDIAFMAATLANGGVHPLTGRRALPEEHVEEVLSVMATCGMYDYAGSWLYEVGMPAKSGVGGGIVAVLPGRFGIGVFSPRLDAKGNSVRGIDTCRRISWGLGLNLFNRANDPAMALGRVYTGVAAPSRRQPTPAMRARLAGTAHRIKFLALHGFLSVDGVEFVIRRMQGLASDADSFILDMHRVDGISEAGARLLNEARLGFAGDGIAVVFSRIHDRARLQGPLRKGLARGDRGILSFEDNDRAAEWCENRLLGDLAGGEVAAGSLADSALFKGLPAPLLAAVEAVGRPVDHAPGDRILASGQAGDGRLFFIESGQVSILVPLDSGDHQRVATLGPGMIFGEMVLLGHTTRSASAFADTAGRCRVFEASDLDAISQREPQLRITLLENLAKDMAAKLRGSTQWIAALA
jgi:glutaminase